MRNFRTRSADAGSARSKWLAHRFGRELQLARLASGLSQARLATLAGVSQTVVSQAERGSSGISLDVRCRLVAGTGHDLGWRLFPVSSISLRDSGQLAVAKAIVSVAHESFLAELEHAVAPGDMRAADLLLALPDEVLHIEIERALVDAQAQFRAAQLKRAEIAKHEQRPIRLIIAVPDTRASRERIAALGELIQRAFPRASRQIWRALRTGQPVCGDGILFVRQDRLL